DRAVAVAPSQRASVAAFLAGSRDMTAPPAIAAVGRALAPYRYSQQELLQALQQLWLEQHVNPERLQRLHEAVQVGARYLALPIEAYRQLRDFGEANDAFIGVGTELAVQASRRALDAAGVDPSEVTALFFTTVTGLATPTIDA